jgi:mono/diheme cytochrome c family protein
MKSSSVRGTIVLSALMIMLAAAILRPAPAAYAYQSAKSLYASKCSVCHGNDGSGNTAKGKELKVQSFASPEFKKLPDAKALEILLKGKGKMEAYEKTLGKEKCEELLAYCRELSNKQ